MECRPLPDRQGDPVCATVDLVAPLAFNATATRTADMGGRPTADRASGAVSPLIGSGPRRGDVDSATRRSTLATATTPGIRTSTTATRTTGTRTTSSGLASSANHDPAATEPTFLELVEAYLDCRQHKRNSASALAFEADLENNLRSLYDDLIDGRYQPGPTTCFAITRPKPREVWAATFRDRIPHHLLYNRIGPHFEARFIADSCACIPGRGTLYAAQRMEAKIRSITQNWSQPAFYLKVDIASFFVSINKNLQRGLLQPGIQGEFWQQLADTILFHDPRRDVIVRGDPKRLALIPPHKSLFQQPAWLGLPIGNLSSQFFANVYLNVIDQHIKHVIGARYYGRYVDDLLILHESAVWLNDARKEIERVLQDRLALRLNPSKTIIQPIDRGVDFVGHVIAPWRRRMRRRTVRTALRRVAAVDAADLHVTGNSYFGLFRQASHSHKDRVQLARVLLRRGRCVDGALTKSYRGRP